MKNELISKSAVIHCMYTLCVLTNEVVDYIQKNGQLIKLNLISLVQIHKHVNKKYLLYQQTPITYTKLFIEVFFFSKIPFLNPVLICLFKPTKNK